MLRFTFFRDLAMLLACLWPAFLFDAAMAAEEPRTFRIYLDADRTENLSSARSIEMGIRTALSHRELLPEGVLLEIVPKDHRGNAKRSFRNILAYLDDPQGLAIIGGMHSPPYMTYKNKINESGALLLLPWSAAGSITRTDAPVNWIFRASVDDSKAGGFLVNQAVVVGECKAPAMLLLESGWGRFNHKQITRALAEIGLSDPPTHFYNADISQAQARIMAREIKRTHADCLIFVGNSLGGSRIITAFNDAAYPIRVFSHWGITGGSFPRKTSHEQRAFVDLQFLQTCLPFGEHRTPAVSGAVDAATSLFTDEFTSLEQQPAPVGFAHAYDLGLILLAALRQVPLDGDILDVRRAVRDALERLEEPIPGLLKTYQRPFSSEGADAHEALGADDLCLARYDEAGNIVFVNTRSTAINQ